MYYIVKYNLFSIVACNRGNITLFGPSRLKVGGHCIFIPRKLHAQLSHSHENPGTFKKTVDQAEYLNIPVSTKCPSMFFVLNVCHAWTKQGLASDLSLIMKPLLGRPWTRMSTWKFRPAFLLKAVWVCCYSHPGNWPTCNLPAASGSACFEVLFVSRTTAVSQISWYSLDMRVVCPFWMSCHLV